ncbi:MAG TPA: hypothetical protein VHR66_26515 [Gemmataceae bacterium]|jgi:hypothetical protein|nr:hypothetical protein [Gemmataceae bacterium]
MPSGFFSGEPHIQVFIYGEAMHRFDQADGNQPVPDLRANAFKPNSRFPRNWSPAASECHQGFDVTGNDLGGLSVNFP